MIEIDKKCTVLLKRYVTIGMPEKNRYDRCENLKLNNHHKRKENQIDNITNIDYNTYVQ